ncbi:MAG TPA: NAD(P)-dependent oxidoreductase [Dongiaceae bacterium]|jgi:nucleoside-diphosphate-sugar epimerase|nr:NAD(P)-dependent oxidoreductase [Dongiaceae bacterium]
MRCLVTGATGFLGSYVVREALARGHKVAAFIRPDGDRSRLADCLDRIEIITGDLLAIEKAETGLANFAPELALHLGWHGVAGGDRNAITQADNIVATVKLCAFLGQIQTRAFVGAGSQAEYGPANRIIDESALTRPTTLYGIAKLSAALMAERMCAERHMRFAWLRVFSTYGPGDNPHWMIPSLISALRRGETPKLTACEQKWDFLHAEDAARAFLAVAETDEAQGIFNLGSGEAPPLVETVMMLRDAVAPLAKLDIGAVPYRPDQVMHLQADISRLRRTTGWQPRRSLREGLKEIAKHP